MARALRNLIINWVVTITALYTGTQLDLSLWDLTILDGLIPLFFCKTSSSFVNNCLESLI